MPSLIQLTKSTTAYEVKPSHPKAGLIIIQEIFGVNSHIRQVAEEYAREGYHVLAPQLFDPLQKSVELSYEAEAMVLGRNLVAQLGWEQPLADIQVAIDFLKSSYVKVGAVGYCWGGSLAFLAACRLKNLDQAVSYYGRQVYDFMAETPKCPVLFHFGDHDPMIPMEKVAAIQKTFNNNQIFIYNAGHGFNCDQRKDYVSQAAALAKKRTLRFLEGSENLLMDED